MADANDGRVTLWRAPNGTLHAFPVEGGVEGVWRPRADDDAREERLKAAEAAARVCREDAEANATRAERAEAATMAATRDRDEWRRRAESARALLKEARPHVQHSIDEGAETGIELLARIDAETRGEDGPGTRRDDETDSNPTDTRNHARAAGNGAATPP